MKKYIERDKLYDIELLLMSDIVKENPVANYILEQVLFDIKETPAADVREVKHGYWVNAYPEIEPNPMFMYGICSECGAETGCQTKYCHECGSMMESNVEVTGQEKINLFKKHGKIKER